jgi:hypothetical protein
MNRLVHTPLTALSLVTGLYVVALLLPAMHQNDGQWTAAMPGYMCLAYLPFALFVYPEAWANVAIFGWMLCMAYNGKGPFTSVEIPMTLLFMSTMALVFSLLFLRQTEMPIAGGFAIVPIAIGSGYYAWVAAMLTAFAASVGFCASGWNAEANNRDNQTAGASRNSN